MAEINPEKIGKYKVVSVIAKGGMGIVYKAIHPTLRRYIIIKKLTMRGNPELRERFKREAKILLDLHHANIVHMFDYFVESGSHYIALEFVDGMSLDTLLVKAKKLSCQTAMLIFRDACLALLYAHENGIVHRDIKPGNILISAHGEIKLADFGIASSEKETETHLTQDGSTLGTPSYMPPEQFSETKNVDKRADIYAMGVMLYEMVTGVKPFGAKFSTETIMHIQKGKFSPPEKIEVGIDKTVKKIIKKTIRPNPNKRFKSISKMLLITEKYLSQFDSGEIRKDLEEKIRSKKIGEKTFKKRFSLLPFIFPTILAVFFALGIHFSWKEGFIHTYLLFSWYKPVHLELELPNSVQSKTDLPMRAYFFINDNDAIPEIHNSMRTFEIEKKDGRLLTKPLYLRPGNYRLKLVIGSYVWWQSFKMEDKEVFLLLDFLKNKNRNLEIHVSAFDENEIPLREYTTEVLLPQGWIDITKVDPKALQSGSIVKVKVSAKGYETELFSLKIEWYQDELFILSRLKKIE